MCKANTLPSMLLALPPPFKSALKKYFKKAEKEKMKSQSLYIITTYTYASSFFLEMNLLIPQISIHTSATCLNVQRHTHMDVLQNQPEIVSFLFSGISLLV